MDADRYRRTKQLFLAVCDLTPAERAIELERACAGDAELRKAVEEMLSFDGLAQFDVAPLRVPGVEGELAPGRVLEERYEIRALLGIGGLGEVWSAQQLVPVRRDVAIKVVKLGMDTRQVLARFEAERRTLAILDHPHIAHVLDAGSTPTGRPYFVMELIEGVPVTTYADRAGLGLRERLRLFVQICNAVQHAHQKGIVHRDLKPSNVLVAVVDEQPFVKVIDFGIAKAMSVEGDTGSLATLEHQVIGTPAYMSPEQARGARDVDTRTDVWALGVILHELLVGSTPFAPTIAGSAAPLAHLLDDTPTPRPSTKLHGASTAPLIQREELKGDLDWIVLRALEKDRERRYPSAAALADELGRHLRHEPVDASPPSRWYRARKFVRRNRTGTAATALVFVALVAGIVSTTIARNAERDARLEAVAALGEAESAGWFIGDLLSAADPRERGRDVRVVDVLEHADESIRERFEGRPRAEIRVRRILGITLRELGQLDEALVHQLRALEASRTAYPPGHPELLRVLLSITALYDEMGRYADSEPLHREALDLYPQVYGPESRQTLGAQCNFGLFFYDQARNAEAEVQLRSTLEAMERTLEPDDDYLLNCMQGLGTALLELQRVAEARERFEEVSRRGEAKDGVRSLHALNSKLNLALAAQREHKYEEALKYVDEALTRTEVIFGLDHWRMGRVLDQRADALAALARTEEVRAARVRAHEVYAAAFGPDHPWTKLFEKKLEQTSREPDEPQPDGMPQ